MRSFFFYWLKKYAFLYFILIFLLFVWVFSVDGKMPITVYHSETLELLLNGLLMIVLTSTSKANKRKRDSCRKNKKKKQINLGI
ncbi:hypothetical protein CHCC14821_3421 [Bacillus paralicheniformis]|nr:hypothetical protein CHCC14821_3421 [Bacillus paralicheniformis]